jgi:hypothetical protein
MNKLMLIFCLLLFAVLLSAQVINPYMNLIHSSRCDDGNLRVRWEDLTTNMLQTECLYSTGANWQNALVENYSATQMQALVPYTFGQTLRYRLRTEVSYATYSGVAMHAPYMDADAWPPTLAKLGHIGTDATMDSVTVYSPVLDLTDTWFGVTSDKFYSGMANVANMFPTFNSITSYNIYMTTLTSPQVVVDSLMYAMLYTFNMGDLISPGLYKVKIDSTSMPVYTRIGNIQSMVVAGKLYMACNITDLTSDPDFGPWPNALNALAVVSLTFRLGYDQVAQTFDFGIGDYSNLSAQIFQDNVYSVAQNSPPEISGFQLDTNLNLVNFIYTDANADFPLMAQFQLDGGEIVDLLPESMDYSQPVSFIGSLPYTPQTGILRVSDNNIDFVEYVYPEVLNPIDPLPIPPLQCTLPNPFRSGLVELNGLHKGSVNVGLYNLRGEKLSGLYKGWTEDPYLSFSWDGRSNGSRLPSGVYFLRVVQSGHSLVRKFVLSN